jgi:hypothetical protein
VPIPDVQRLSAGEQITRNPSLLKQAIMPQTQTSAVQKPIPVSTKPYVQKIQKPRATDIITGLPTHRWPTSFKKAYHKPTPDEKIMSGVNNLDHMARKLLGR